MQKWWILVAAVVMLFSVTVVDTQSAEAATGNQVVSEGKKVQGSPYSWGGNSPSGFDCSGFVRYAYGQAGIDLPYGTVNQAREGQAVSRSNLQPGDIVFFAGTYRSGISHNGIYVGNNQFIHASSSQGVTITSMNNSYWEPKYHSARRVASSSAQETVASTADVSSSSETSSSSNSESVSSSTAEQAEVVNTSRANVRNGGSLSDSVIGGIDGGTTVEVQEVHNYWAKVSNGSTEGYVSLSLLDLDSNGGSASVSSGDAEIVNSVNVNVRSGASMDNAVTGSISGGSTVEVKEEYNYWAKVSDGSTEGYVSLRFLDN
jgi:uncharacterized protein YraI